MSLDRKNIAILTANGVNQNEIATIQRALIQKRSFPKIIGAGGKLITGWDGNQWGHNFAMDINVTEALGVDYDVLIIPGGERAMDVLTTTAHTKRILNSFIVAGKPVLVMGDASSLFKTFDLPQTGENLKFVEDCDEAQLLDLISWFESFDTTGLDQKVA